jgi:hypothetical protein
VVQRREEPVVEAVKAGHVVLLRVDRLDPAEQLPRLVDDVRTEIEQHTAAGGGEATGRWVLLHARLERDELAERAAVEQRTNGEEVGVPPPVLIHRQCNPRAFGRLDRRARRSRVGGERLVAHGGQPAGDRLVDEGDVGRQWGGDHHGVHLGGHQSIYVVDSLRPRVVMGQLCPPLR